MKRWIWIIWNECVSRPKSTCAILECPVHGAWCLITPIRFTTSNIAWQCKMIEAHWRCCLWDVNAYDATSRVDIVNGKCTDEDWKFDGVWCLTVEWLQRHLQVESIYSREPIVRFLKADTRRHQLQRSERTVWWGHSTQYWCSRKWYTHTDDTHTRYILFHRLLCDIDRDFEGFCSKPRTLYAKFQFWVTNYTRWYRANVRDEACNGLLRLQCLVLWKAICGMDDAL